MARNPDLKTVDNFASTIDSDEKVMSSSNGGSQLYGHEDHFHVVNSDEETSTTVASGAKKKKKRIVKGTEKEQKEKAKTDIPAIESAVEGEKTVNLEKKAQQVEAMEQELASMQTKYNELDEKLKEYGNLHISEEDLHKLCAAFWFRMQSTGGVVTIIEEINMAAAEYRGHGVAVVGLKRLKSEKPIKGKWFKQFLKKIPKKTMHEALVKALTKLSIEQLLLWESLCRALAKMSVPGDVGGFPTDTPTVLA
ncbi:OLC1v1012209C1 [Oldenlandia corymbosa var. corymbosa]|uniref:OLC1v1012209C1 n=1 Tax=Oldenlandia corymbosa var. corymbosa TaxID=529605 RepID=A0AAV1DVE3_OLDCO|nr:OLC1v1012209C1 [Oldenlandia corymbosa var. corymbosa]